MKNYTSLCYLGMLLIFSAFNNPASNNLDCNICGQWSWEKNDDKHDFSLNIYMKDGILNGSHCYVLNGGEKMDCPDNKDQSSFSMSNFRYDTITVSIRSFYSGKTGKIKLEIKNGKLYWKLVKPPKGEYYFPKEAILVK